MFNEVSQLSGNSTPYQAASLVATQENSASFTDAMTKAAETSEKPEDIAAARRAGREAAMKLDPLERQRNIAEITSRYDVQNISPNEIDQMTDELYKAGYEPEKDLMMLETRGARFNEHITRTMAEHHGIEVDEDELAERMNTRSNLLTQLQESREMAERYGDPTDAWDAMIAMAEDIDQQGRQYRSEATAQTQSQIDATTMSGLIAAQAAAAGSQP